MDGEDKYESEADQMRALESKLARLQAEQIQIERNERNASADASAKGPKGPGARPETQPSKRVGSRRGTSYLGYFAFVSVLVLIWLGIRNPDLFSNRMNEPFVRGLRESRMKEERAYPGITGDRPDRVKRALATLSEPLSLGTDGKSVQSLRFLFGPLSKLPYSPPGFALASGSSRRIKTFINEDIYKFGKAIGDQVFGHCMLISGRAINVPRSKTRTQNYTEDAFLIVNGKKVRGTYDVSLYQDTSGAPYNHFSISSGDLPLRTK